jgi:serine protease Do
LASTRRSTVAQGISFAIPIDEASRVSDQLRTSGRVIRGRIAVSIDQVTKEVAESIGLGKAMGALVRSVESGGPAEKAGIEAGDIITKFDGKAIEKSGDLPRIVGGVKPGTKVSVQVFRRGAHRDLSVTVAEVEPERARRTAGQSEPKPKTSVETLGLVVADLSDTQKRELKIKNGVRVESADAAAARAGLREGDVILSVDNTEVNSSKHFEGLASKLDKTKSVTVLVKRGEAATFIVIKPVR